MQLVREKNNAGQSQCSIFGGAALVTLCATVLFLSMTVGTKNGGRTLAHGLIYSAIFLLGPLVTGAFSLWQIRKRPHRNLRFLLLPLVASGISIAYVALYLYVLKAELLLASPFETGISQNQTDLESGILILLLVQVLIVLGQTIMMRGYRLLALSTGMFSLLLSLPNCLVVLLALMVS
jgi:MFS family permease